MHHDFGWTLQWLDDRTNERYKNKIKARLDAGFPLDTSQSAAIDKETSQPLLYKLSFTKGFLKRSIMLAFFDTAGEDLNKDVDTMTSVNKYIISASGIICLLDPLQLPKVRASVEARIGKGGLPEQGKDTGDIINQVEQLIRRGQIARGKSGMETATIKIPLALAFSKIDAIDDGGTPDATLLPKDCAIFRDTRHRGVLHHAEFTTIHQLMQGWLREVDEQQNISNNSKAFAEVGYFGFSALGCNPMLTSGRLPHAPRPVRVEDPFLWILYKNGLITMKKG